MSVYELEELELEERDYALAEAEEEDDEMPNYTHGELQWQIIQTLFAALMPDYKALPPITFQGVEKKFTPDVVVYPKRTRPRDTSSRDYRVEQTPPLLAVEIISPDQTMFSMVEKCRAMLESGVEECWILEPTNDTITVCRKDIQFVRHRGEVLEYALCSRAISVDEIFDI